MKKTILSVVAAVAIGTTGLMAGGAVAPAVEVELVPVLTGFYVGAGYTSADNEVIAQYELDGVEGTNNSLALIAGYNINEYLAVEGRYSFLSEDSYDYKIANVTVGDVGDVDGSVWSIFIKPQYSVTPEFKVYGLLGYGSTTLTETTDGDVDIISEETAFQYGLGGAYEVTTNVEVFADWTRALDDDFTTAGFGALTGTTDLYTFGVNYKF